MFQNRTIRRDATETAAVSVVAALALLGLRLGGCVGGSSGHGDDRGQAASTTGDDGNPDDGLADNDNAASAVEPVLPDDYRSGFSLVRNCVPSAGHGGAMVRVYVNDVGASAYLAGRSPMPVGAVVVKEEFFLGCGDDDAVGQWSVMVKREAGFDEADGDWQWQQIAAADMGILHDDKTTCIACHTAPDCIARDHMCTAP